MREGKGSVRCLGCTPTGVVTVRCPLCLANTPSGRALTEKKSHVRSRVKGKPDPWGQLLPKPRKPWVSPSGPPRGGPSQSQELQAMLWSPDSHQGGGRALWLQDKNILPNGQSFRPLQTGTSQCRPHPGPWAFAYICISNSVEPTQPYFSKGGTSTGLGAFAVFSEGHSRTLKSQERPAGQWEHTWLLGSHDAGDLELGAGQAQTLGAELSHGSGGHGGCVPPWVPQLGGSASACSSSVTSASVLYHQRNG